MAADKWEDDPWPGGARVAYTASPIVIFEILARHGNRAAQDLEMVIRSLKIKVF